MNLTTKFKYNEETKMYERYLNGSIQKDWITNEKRTTKNIIITYARNYTTDEEEVIKHIEQKLHDYTPIYAVMKDSKVKIIVLPTNEELSIARETKELTQKK